MVVNKQNEKKPRKQRKPMTAEQKAKAVENLKKGREKSLATRRAKAEAKKKAKENTTVKPVSHSTTISETVEPVSSTVDSSLTSGEDKRLAPKSSRTLVEEKEPLS